MGETAYPGLGKGIKKPLCLLYKPLQEGVANLSESEKRAIPIPLLVLFNSGKTVADEHGW